MSEKEWKESIEALKTQDIASGQYYPKINDCIYEFTLDLDFIPKKIKKTYEGKDSGFQWQYRVRHYNLNVSKVVMEYLKEKKEKKFNYLNALKEGDLYILELPPGASRDFGEFLDELPKLDMLISMERFGEKRGTKYKFRKVIMESPEVKEVAK